MDPLVFGEPSNAFDRAVEALAQGLLIAATATIFAILCGNTVLRYVSGTSLRWASEVPELLFPWMVMAGIVLAARRGGHLATTFLVAVLPSALRRPILVSVWLAVAGVHGVLAVATAQLLPLVHDEKSPILRVPGSVTYGCVLLGLVLLALLALRTALRLARHERESAPTIASGADTSPNAAGREGDGPGRS
ncbi:MAG: TRAP transporter small permease [Casimicrobiaceae bacterium]|nr:TRAP transporter small permease [Casimicrobiaceae bacterium]MCX8097804.1 TRAP transporter small permease [Casimicrobiaceae bacterium]MDW8312654.1 TRAP transporter small permease [Burkholderiales bacterium]